jgi:hypothetical protein
MHIDLENYFSIDNVLNTHTLTQSHTHTSSRVWPGSIQHMAVYNIWQYTTNPVPHGVKDHVSNGKWQLRDSGLTVSSKENWLLKLIFFVLCIWPNEINTYSTCIVPVYHTVLFCLPPCVSSTDSVSFSPSYMSTAYVLNLYYPFSCPFLFLQSSLFPLSTRPTFSRSPRSFPPPPLPS